MASSLRLVPSNRITRSTFLSTAVSASRLLNISGHQSYATMPKDDFDDKSSLRIMYPKSCSMSFNMWMNGTKSALTLKIPDEGLSVAIHKPGLKMDMRACAAAHNTWFVQDINQSTDKTSSDIKEEMKDGMLKGTLPNEDEFKSTSIILNDMANNIISSFCDITSKHSWPYYDMFSDRSILGKGLCRVIAMRSPVTSFSIFKEETAKGLDIDTSVPGDEEIKITTQGLRVSLNMNENIDREDVKVFFDYDTLFIEGKTKTHHYITGIHLPEGIHMKNNWVKREMKDGVFYAFLPCSGKKEELHELLKPKLCITN